MNCIHIYGDYYLRSDSLQWKVSKKGKPDKDGNDTYLSVSFHSDPHQAVISLSRRLARENNCDTLGQLLGKAESVATELSKALIQAELITNTINMEKMA